MSAHVVCPICGDSVVCDGPHEGPHEKIEPVVACPLKKGAIYVFVKNDLGRGVGKVKTKCKDLDAVNTNPEGFVFYEQLDEGPYPVSIDLEASESIARDPHYTFVRTSVNASVKTGKITIVEFQLHRYATLQVEVKRTDNQKLVGEAKIQVEAGKVADNPPKAEEKSLETGPVPIEKLKPTGIYKVTVTLVEVHDKKFKISGTAEKPGIQVKPDAPNTIEFLVDPLFWIQFAMVEGKDTVSGAFTVQQTGKDPAKHDTKGDGTLELDNLPAGKMKVTQVDLSASYEFVAIKPGD